MRPMLALVIGLQVVGSAAAQTPAAPPTTLELVEDLRILSILNELQPTREQSTRLAAVAAAGKEGLAAIEADVKALLDGQRARLAQAREQVLRGGRTPGVTDTQLTLASQAAQGTRTQKTEALIVTLAERVRRILTPAQAARIEADLAPTIEQPWRRYGRIVSGSSTGSRSSVRMPNDPGKWLKELRDLRIDSAEGNPAHEIQDFGRKLTRGIPSQSPYHEPAAAQARAFATQVLALPQDAFQQREVALARLASKQELETRNRQRILEGKPLESFDPYRWLVEEVMLSPRAEVSFRDRAAAR